MMKVLSVYLDKYVIYLALVLAMTISPITIPQAGALALTKLKLEFGAEVNSITNETTGIIVPGDFVVDYAISNPFFDQSTSGNATVTDTFSFSAPTGPLQVGDQVAVFYEIEAQAQGQVFQDASADFFADGITDLTISFENFSATDTYSAQLEIAYFIQSISSATLTILEEASSSTFFDFVEDVNVPDFEEFVQSSASGKPIDFASNSFTVDLLFDPNVNPEGFILFRPLSTTGSVTSQVPIPGTAFLLALGVAGICVQKRINRTSNAAALRTK